MLDELPNCSIVSRIWLAALRSAAEEGELTKFFDVNLTQVLTDTPPLRDTVEIRILPGSIDADEIVSRAALMELLLELGDPIRRC